MERNEYYEESKKVIENWANKKNNAYIKQSCGADEGCIYDLTDDKSGVSMRIDIRIMEEGALVFEAFPGIIVQNDILTPVVARYTQEKILSRLGMVNVNMRTREIIYHCETLMMENTITEETLEKLEEEAVNTLGLHYINLRNLALGKFFDMKDVIDCKKGKKKASSRDKKSDYNKKVLFEFMLENSLNHNAVCTGTGEDGEQKLYCQCMMENECINICYEIVDGMLVVTGTYGEKGFVVPEAYRYAVASYLTGENSKHKYSSLLMGINGEGIHCRFCTSLLDGPIGEKTAIFIHIIIMKTLEGAIKRIMTLGSGLYMDDNCKSEEPDRQMDEQKRREAMLIRMLRDRAFMSSSEHRESADKLVELPHIAVSDLYDADDIDASEFEDAESDLSMSDFANELGESSEESA